MRKGSMLLAITLLFAIVAGCRLMESLGGDPKAGTVDTLWPDVPPLDGAKKADLALPLGVRLALRTMMQGKISFIAFTTTRSAQEVKDYYDANRMKAAGWKPNEKGCIGDTENGKNQGAVCLFDRMTGEKHEGLAIIIAQDEKTKETDLFYARLDLTEPSPSPSK
jgi:hypothetical protein